jgi:hypothetical protein
MSGTTLIRDFEWVSDARCTLRARVRVCVRLLCERIHQHGLGAISTDEHQGLRVMRVITVMRVPRLMRVVRESEKRVKYPNVDTGALREQSEA